MSRDRIGKLFALIVAAPLLAPTAGLAGDYAERALLGFSPDGRYFAFEEYGVQDGSGYPYANIFLIDTTTDDWVAETPIRVLIEGQDPPLSETRSEAADRFRPFLIEYEIGAEGYTAAMNPLTETSADAHYVSFHPRLRLAPPGKGYELVMQEYDLPAPDCPDIGQSFRGFQLAMTAPDGEQRLLARDDRIPGSRKCPLSYAISEVVTYHPPNGEPVFAVIISVLSLGFEGPDRRFIAVTGRL